MSEIKTLGFYLLNLVKDKLPDLEFQQLSLLLDLMLADLSEGSSCSRLSVLSRLSGINSSGILELFLKSGLAVESDFNNQDLRPLPVTIIRLDNDCLVYVSKYLVYEVNLSAKIIQLSKLVPDYDDKLYQKNIEKLVDFSQHENYPNNEQLAAIIHAANSGLSVISGGPGTGKTTTVTMLLWLFYQLYGNQLTVKICAPTGKAATRVRDSVENSFKKLLEIPEFRDNGEALLGLLANGSNFSTIHKLLGYLPGSIYFRHNQNNPLPVDILIVDESSMIGLPLFSKLIDAVDEKQIRHIIFLGDKNQLSSVEEGAVFTALMELQIERPTTEPLDLFSLPQAHKVAIELNISNRNQPQIASVAQLILQQNYSGLLKVLENYDSVKLLNPHLSLLMAQLLADNGCLIQYLRQMQERAVEELSYKIVIELFNQQTILCLTNQGILGCENLNRLIERNIRQKFAFTSEWYTGRPIIIQQNDYNLGVFNGDIGVCLLENNKIVVIFNGGRKFIPEVLPEYKLAYAITVHKSQGSEYQRVNVILGEYAKLGEAVNLLTRELFYTAVTRARQQVTIFSDKPALQQCLATVTKRLSGLPELFNLGSG